MATVEPRAPIADRPPRLSANPFPRVADDLRVEWRGRGSYPPGPSDFSLARTQAAYDPLPLPLPLEAYGAYVNYVSSASHRLPESSPSRRPSSPSASPASPAAA